MFCEYCSWFEPLRENDDIAGLAAPRRVQDPHPSEGEVSLETTTLCFSLSSQINGLFPHLVLVNASGAKLYPAAIPGIAAS